MISKSTSILSQLQHLGVPSFSCEGQYCCDQKGCFLYSIRPEELVGICAEGNERKDQKQCISRLYSFIIDRYERDDKTLHISFFMTLKSVIIYHFQ